MGRCGLRKVLLDEEAGGNTRMGLGNKMARALKGVNTLKCHRPLVVSTLPKRPWRYAPPRYPSLCPIRASGYSVLAAAAPETRDGPIIQLSNATWKRPWRGHNRRSPLLRRCRERRRHSTVHTHSVVCVGVGEQAKTKIFYLGRAHCLTCLCLCHSVRTCQSLTSTITWP